MFSSGGIEILSLYDLILELNGGKLVISQPYEISTDHC